MKTDPKPEQFNVSDSKGSPVTARLFAADPAHVTLILPGLRYDADMLLLQKVRERCLAQGRSVICLDYDYTQDQTFLQSNEADQLRRLAHDGQAFVDGLAGLGHGVDLVVGKSLGTICMGGMSNSQISHWGWMTPSLVGTDLPNILPTLPGHHFCLIGNDDPSLEASRNPTLTAMPNFTRFESSSFDHAWNHVSGSNAQADGTNLALNAFFDWLADDEGDT